MRAFALVGLILLVASTGVSCKTADCRETATCASPPKDGGASDAPSGPADLDPNGDGFAFDPIPTPPRLVHDGSVTLKLSVRRGAKQTDDIVVSVDGLPDGVTPDPLTIKGFQTTVDLILRSTAAAKQGPFEAKVVGTGAKTTADAKVEMFVRGKQGELDTTFGDVGRRIAPTGTVGKIFAMVLSPKDEIYVVGGCAREAACIAKLTADGIPDANYNGGALVRFAVPNATQIYSAALDTSDRLVVATATTSVSDLTPSIGRLTPTGKPDTTFGARDGVRNGVHSFTGEVPSADGQITMGYSTLVFGPDGSIYFGFNTDGAEVLKLDPNGNRVTSFGVGGFSIFRWADFTMLGGLTATDAGSLGMAVGYRRNQGPVFGGGLVKISATTGGYGGGPLDDYPRYIMPLHPISTVDGRGRTVVTMQLHTIQLNTPTSGVERFTEDGKTLDQSFGTGGVTELPEFAEAVVAAQDGSVYAPQCVSYDPTDNPGRDSVVRLTATGQLDSTWGSGGRVDVQSPKDARTQRVALQSDGRVILLGYNQDENYVLRIWN